MNRAGIWSLYRGYQRWSASRAARGLGVVLVLAVGVVMYQVHDARGLQGAFRFTGLVVVLMSPIAGLDAWLGTMLRGLRMLAWARAAFFFLLWLGGLYLLLDAETVVSFVVSGTGSTAP